MQKYVSIICLILSISAFGSTFVPVSAKNQLKESDAIVYGNVIDISYILTGKGVVTKVFLKLDKWIGVEPDNYHLEVYYPGGELDEIATKVEGSPIFTPGEQVVLFLAKDKEDKYWGKNLGLGKYSEKNLGSGKILVNELFPYHPKIGQIPSKYFFGLAQKVKSQNFQVRSKDKYEIHQLKEVTRLNTNKKRGRSIATAIEKESNESRNEISTLWLLIILGLMGGASMLRNRRKS